MTVSYKVLGQAAPAANTDTTLYSTPASTQSVVSTIFVTNRGSSLQSFSIAVVPSGETLANKHYLAQGIELDGKSFVGITAGITMNQTDSIIISANANTFSFSAFGTEIA